ncbi:MAG: hypothetical protein ACR2P5_02915 [Gammaproteobacteria bacterium]
MVELLKEVLPVSQTLSPETVRNHLHATATRLEQALGEEQECLFTGTEDEWAELPLPDGPMTVGIDGGMVRAPHKAGFFEVIAGKSIVAFQRNEAEDIPSAKRFGFVQTYDTKPRRRLWELMKSQGMQENQQVVFMSDGGDSVRNLQAYLHPSSEHILDWFHVVRQVSRLNNCPASVQGRPDLVSHHQYPMRNGREVTTCREPSDNVPTAARLLPTPRGRGRSPSIDGERG